MFAAISRIFAPKERAPLSEPTLAPVEPVLAPLDADTLHDYVVNLLFARGRQSLSGVGDMLTPNMAHSLNAYFRSLADKGYWNKVGRISKIACSEKKAWQDGGARYVRVGVAWKALDFVVDCSKQSTEPGFVVEGSPHTMDAFQEDWTFVSKGGAHWKVDAMGPASESVS